MLPYLHQVLAPMGTFSSSSFGQWSGTSGPLLTQPTPLLFQRSLPIFPLSTRIFSLVRSLLSMSSPMISPLPTSSPMMSSLQMCSLVMGPLQMCNVVISSSMMTDSTQYCQCWMMMMTIILILHCCHLCLSGLWPLLPMLLTLFLNLLNSQSHPHHWPLFQQALLYLTNMILCYRRPFLARLILLLIVKAFFVSSMDFDDPSSALWKGNMVIFCDNLWM